jgi:hypothetical protein
VSGPSAAAGATGAALESAAQWHGALLAGVTPPGPAPAPVRSQGRLTGDLTAQPLFLPVPAPARARVHGKSTEDEQSSNMSRCMHQRLSGNRIGHRGRLLACDTQRSQSILNGLRDQGDKKVWISKQNHSNSIVTRIVVTNNNVTSTRFALCGAVAEWRGSDRPCDVTSPQTRSVLAGRRCSRMSEGAMPIGSGPCPSCPITIAPLGCGGAWWRLPRMGLAHR